MQVLFKCMINNQFKWTVLIDRSISDSVSTLKIFFFAHLFICFKIELHDSLNSRSLETAGESSWCNTPYP